MNRILHIFIFFLFTMNIQAQKDTLSYLGALPQGDIARTTTSANVTIFPVPVRDNSFTIKTDREISFIRITNIIGQDIFRLKNQNQEQQIRIYLDNPKRGMYIVTINFSDGTRVVKKIMIEESE